MCPTEDDKLHTYCVYYSAPSSIIETEEFRIIDSQTNRGYLIWIGHAEKEVQFSIFSGVKLLTTKRARDINLNIDWADEKSLVNKLEKLSLLF